MADAVPEANADVWGAVFEFDERDIGSLDSSEGFAPGRAPAANSYTREERQVFRDGKLHEPLTGWIYFAQRQNNPPRPNAAYKNLIVEGARYWHLPPDYIAELERIEVS